MTIDMAYRSLYTGALVVLAAFIGLVLIAAAVKKTATDRILCINMVGTMVICCIAILSRMLKEGFLLDVALIYAMISFVAVLMLAMTYIPPKPERKDFPSEEKAAALPARENHKKRKRRAKRGHWNGSALLRWPSFCWERCSRSCRRSPACSASAS